MPSACQPSKKSGSSSTQRRYFSTALSSSPIARSPFASSKSSSSVGIAACARSLAGRRLLEAGRLAPVLQPFKENDHAFLLKILRFEQASALLVGGRLDWLPSFPQRSQ